MWRTHFTLALRRLMRRPGRASLHVLGLALGLAACFVVALYALHELTYDRFHENADRLYRVQDEISIGAHTFKSNGVSYAVLDRLEADVPGFEAYVQAAKQPGILRVPETGAVFEENAVLTASDKLFEVFTFPLVRGAADQVLAAPDGAVLTQAMAQKLFGDADPIGQTFTYERGGYLADSVQTTYRVTGIAAAPPGNSSIQFQVVLPLPGLGPDDNPEVSGFNTPVYVLLGSAADTAAVLQAIGKPVNQEAEENAASIEHGGKSFVTPFAGYYASEEQRAPLLYLFGTMALFVLVIAVINYTNLATAQAAQRGREVGVRKTLGASRLSLRGQFVAESLLLALAAGAAALAFVLGARPALSAFFDVQMAVTPLTHPWLLAAMGALVLLTGLVAGAYPAFVLARQRPVEALRGARGGRERGTLRKGLVVVQFALAVGMIGATAIVDRQLRYGQDTALGFESDQIALLDLSAPALQHAGVALKEAMQNVPGVQRVLRASAVPGGGFVQVMGSRDDGDDESNEGGEMTAVLTAEPAFSDMFGLTYLAGRPLRAGEKDAVVLNERAARDYGLITDDPQAAIGQKVDVAGTHEVVGVVSDFFVSSLKQPIQPVALYAPPETEVIGAAYINSLRVIAVEVRAGQVREVLAGMEDAWKAVVPDYPFQYTFVSDAFAEKVRDEARVRSVFGAAALLAALLACLGLFGLAAFAAEQRRKEIGVRKVLGASVQSLVALLSRDFALLVGLAFVVAAPLTYYLMQRWLERFTYRIDVGVGTLLMAGAAVLVLALLTVSYHALRAATADPTRALRSE